MYIGAAKNAALLFFAKKPLDKSKITCIIKLNNCTNKINTMLWRKAINEKRKDDYSRL